MIIAMTVVTIHIRIFRYIFSFNLIYNNYIINKYYCTSPEKRGIHNPLFRAKGA
jgi:hypothetical protein